MPILLIIVLMLGLSGGTSIAAENALPGDMLYGVKVHINEEVREALTLSSEASAAWEVRRAERRLEEAEELVTKDRLTADARATIEANFAAHADRVASRIATFAEQKDFDTATDVSAHFASSLSAHALVLERLEQTNPEVKTELDALVSIITETKKDTEESSAAAEEHVAQNENGEVQVAAEAKLESVNRAIADVRELLADASTSLNATASAAADARIAIAEQNVAEGKTRMEAGAYKDALALFQAAAKISHEGKVLLHAEHNFNLGIGLDLSADKEEPTTTEKTEDTASGKIQGETEGTTDAQVQVPDIHTRASGVGTGKIQLGY